MKLNRKFSFLTVIMVLLLVLSAFTACNSEDDDTTNTSDTTVGDVTAAPVVENLPLDISLNEYNLVYPVAWPEKAAIDSFKKSYEGVTGGFLPASTDQVQGGVITDAITATKEILIGQTNRPESAAALPNRFPVKILGVSIRPAGSVHRSSLLCHDHSPAEPASYQSE